MNLRKALTIFSFILICTLLITGIVLVSQYYNAEINIPAPTTNPNNDSNQSTSESFNILIVCEEAAVADDIYIINYSPDTLNVNMLTIPGDFKTSQGNKISSVMGPKGGMGMVDSIKVNLGINIKYYFKFDYTAFAKIVNILNGVTYSVPYALKSETTNLSAGENTYTGEMAVELFRFRDPFDGRYTEEMEAFYDGMPYKRTLLHTDFIYKLLIQKGNKDYITKFPQIISECGTRIETNLGEEDINEFVKNADTVNTNRISQYILHGTYEDDINKFFKFNNTIKEISESSEREYQLAAAVESYFKSDSLR